MGVHIEGGNVVGVAELSVGLLFALGCLLFAASHDLLSSRWVVKDDTQSSGHVN